MGSEVRGTQRASAKGERYEGHKGRLRRERGTRDTKDVCEGREVRGTQRTSAKGAHLTSCWYINQDYILYDFSRQLIFAKQTAPLRISLPCRQTT